MKEEQSKEPMDQLVDLDHDGLDDRLISTRIPQSEKIQDVINRLDAIQLRTLPERTLLKMLADISDDQNELLLRARALERNVHQQLVHGRYNALASMRREIRLLNKEYENLQDQKEKLEHTLQESRLRKNIERVIGPRWNRVMEYTILVLIVFVLVLLIYDLSVVRPPDHILSTWNIFYIDSACCVVFLSEFFFRWSKSDDKWWFLKNHWIDFVTSIPIPPMDSSRLVRVGRAARFIRFFRLLRLLRLFRAIYFFWRGLEKLNDLLDVRMMKKSMKWAFGVIFVGAILILKVEGESAGAHSGVESLALSFWWSFTTVVTGGFGDIYNPTTILGQFLTGLLVMSGMILIGVFTATLTSLYIGEETEDLSAISENVSSQLKELKEELLTKIESQKNVIDTLLAEKNNKE